MAWPRPVTNPAGAPTRSAREPAMPNATRRILLVAVAGGVLFDVLAVGNAAGINAPIIVAAFLVAAFAIAGRDGIARMDPADAWLAPSALVLAALVAVRADDWLVTADLLLAAALAAGAGLSRWRPDHPGPRAAGPRAVDGPRGDGG